MSVSQAVVAKRGYLVNLSTKQAYPFQYNPTQLTIGKQNTWGKKVPIASNEQGREPSTMSSIERQALVFSSADFLKFDSEGNRTITLKFPIDGREQRPGEPAMRRNDEGDILADFAFLRSFLYPKADVQDLFRAVLAAGAGQYAKQRSNEPPAALLVFGELAIEAVVTSLTITETLQENGVRPYTLHVQNAR